MIAINIIAGGVVFVFVLVLVHLNARITRSNNSIHDRLNIIEKGWRNSETCSAIHKGLNGDIREIRDSIKIIENDIKILSKRKK